MHADRQKLKLDEEMRWQIASARLLSRGRTNPAKKSPRHGASGGGWQMIGGQMEALPALRIGYGALACHTSLVIDRLAQATRICIGIKQKPRDIAPGFGSNADRLCGDSLLLPAPAEQA